MCSTWSIILMFLMWTAPIVYSYGLVHTHLKNGLGMHLYEANPLTLAVLAFQRAFWVRGSGEDGPHHLLQYFAVEFVVGVLLLWLCQRLFARLQDNFAQEI
jgi:ABC-2 type transport system permease protein